VGGSVVALAVLVMPEALPNETTILIFRHLIGIEFETVSQASNYNGCIS
jgi:hypothetical protein